MMARRIRSSVVTLRAREQNDRLTAHQLKSAVLLAFSANRDL